MLGLDGNLFCRHYNLHQSHEASAGNTSLKTQLTILITLCVALACHAADAVFSPDGQFVTLLPLAKTNADLWRVNLKTKGIEDIQLNLPKGLNVTSLAFGAEGETIVLAGEAVYVNDAKGTKKLCDTSGVKDADDLTIAPPKATSGMADWIIISGMDKEYPDRRIFYGRKPGGKSFSPVFGRRIDQAGRGAFAPDGRFFFQADNMIWEGSFHYAPDMNPYGLSWSVILNSVGIAPLAYCDSSISNTGKYSVRNTIAVAGNHVYAALSGRHGDDVLLRMTTPAKAPPNNGTDSGDALEAHYRMQAKVLSSVKVLEEDKQIEILAAIVVKGEERVFYLVHPHYDRVQMVLWTSSTEEGEVIGEYKEEAEEEIKKTE